jgi:hypothetical protein
MPTIASNENEILLAIRWGKSKILQVLLPTWSRKLR